MDKWRIIILNLVALLLLFITADYANGLECYVCDSTKDGTCTSKGTCTPPDDKFCILQYKATTSTLKTYEKICSRTSFLGAKTGCAAPNELHDIYKLTREKYTLYCACSSADLCNKDPNTADPNFQAQSTNSSSSQVKVLLLGTVLISGVTVLFYS